ncbi:MAG: hypothetical protein ACREWE_14065 [Gammaproteobacteria bacterium]
MGAMVIDRNVTGLRAPGQIQAQNDSGESSTYIMKVRALRKGRLKASGMTL